MPIRREDLVGTIIDFTDTPKLITEYTGEGSNTVVYSIAPVDDPDKANTVIRLSKPWPVFEMDTLHYHFKVHEELFPDHPLRMTPEERMAKLANEMIGWCSESNAILRSSLHKEIVDACIQYISSKTVFDNTDWKSAASEMLRKGTVLHMLDDFFIYRTKELIDEDSVEPGFEDWVLHLIKHLENHISNLKVTGSYRPASRNMLWQIFCFYNSGYINESELSEIAKDTRIKDKVDETLLQQMIDLIQTLKSRAKMAKESKDGPDRDATEARIAFNCCEYVLNVMKGLTDQASLTRFYGLIKYEMASLLSMVIGYKEQAIAYAKEAVRDLRSPETLIEHHDSLILLGSLQPENSDDRAASVKEILEIRKVLDKDH